MLLLFGKVQLLLFPLMISLSELFCCCSRFCLWQCHFICYKWWVCMRYMALVLLMFRICCLSVCTIKFWQFFAQFRSRFDFGFEISITAIIIVLVAVSDLVLFERLAWCDNRRRRFFGFAEAGSGEGKLLHVMEMMERFLWWRLHGRCYGLSLGLRVLASLMYDDVEVRRWCYIALKCKPFRQTLSTVSPWRLVKIRYYFSPEQKCWWARLTRRCRDVSRQFRASFGRTGWAVTGWPPTL